MEAGWAPDRVIAPCIDERQLAKESAKKYVSRMSFEKSQSILVDDDDLLVTADTIVVVGTDVLHKTENEEHAFTHLARLRGRRHQVYTSLYLKCSKVVKTALVKSIVKMDYLSDADIKAYLKKNEWQGKAGAYSIQHSASMFIPFISGCYTNIIGLPLPKLTKMLKGLGYLNNG